MSRTKLPVTWSEGNLPVQPGLYFVAARYNTGFGSYDFMNWDGEKWLKDPSINVVGWVTLGDFLKLVDAGWPIGDDQDSGFNESFQSYDKKNDGGFVEFE